MSQGNIRVFCRVSQGNIRVFCRVSQGNIRVFCRVRPLLKEEKCGDEVGASHMTFPDDERRTVELERLSDDVSVSIGHIEVA